MPCFMCIVLKAGLLAVGHYPEALPF